MGIERGKRVEGRLDWQIKNQTAKVVRSSRRPPAGMSWGKGPRTEHNEYQPLKPRAGKERKDGTKVSRNEKPFPLEVPKSSWKASVRPKTFYKKKKKAYQNAAGNRVYLH